MIFNKLILGFDYLDEVDFSDIYSVVNVIEQLFQKKDDNKLTENRFYDEANRVFEKMEKTKELYVEIMSIFDKLTKEHIPPVDNTARFDITHSLEKYIF
jgi:hypothetical protein